MSDPFDALGVDVDVPVKMPIIYPGEVDPIVDEEKREGYIEFLPWDSEIGRKLDRKDFKDVVRRGFRQKSRAELLKDAEADDPVEKQVERLAGLATSWHLVGPDGKAIEIPFSKENAEKLFASPKMGWLRRQAWVWINNEANFMKSPSKSS